MTGYFCTCTGPAAQPSTCPIHVYDTFNAKAWMRRAFAAEDELRRIRAVLAEPVWNEHRVLVWSLLDIERIDKVLEQRGR